MIEAKLTPVDKISGVASTTIEKLRKVGLTTFETIAVTPAAEIVRLTGMGKDTAEKVTRKALEKVSKYVTADELLKREKKRKMCTTGAPELDGLLGGGLETGVITELAGEFGSGKTQVCFTVCILSQLPEEEGGLDGEVCFIDTEGTFNAERIEQIATERGLDATKFLQGIHYIEIYNSQHQEIIIKSLPEYLDGKNIKTIIVDSMIGHFRGEYIGRALLAPRQQAIGSCLSALRRVAKALNLLVLITNQAVSTPDSFYRDPNKPTGGHVVGHAANNRLWLRKGRGVGTRIAKLIDSSYLAPGQAQFHITEKGVEGDEEIDDED